jgi:transcriptional repressor NrdR
MTRVSTQRTVTDPSHPHTDWQDYRRLRVFGKRESRLVYRRWTCFNVALQPWSLCEVATMRCPYCHIDNDKVIDTRASEEGYSIRRRRQCLSCERRYTTYERLEELEIKVVKKDGVRESFDPGKLRVGLAKACWKRTISDEKISEIVADIQGEIYATADREIDSSQLGELVMAKLRHLDQVAYVRFASVYREFKDARDFVDELQPMLREEEEISE